MGVAAGAVAVWASDRAHAAEVIFGAESSVEYDTNVFRTEDDVDDDGTFVFGPTFRLREDHKALTYDLRYHPTYDKYFTFDELDGFEQRLTAAAAYRLSPRTEITAGNNFYMLSSISRQAFVTELQTDPIVQDTRENILVDEYRFGAAHLFTSRLRGALDFNGYLYDPEDKDRASSLTNGVNLSTLYSLTRVDRLGGGVGFTNQDFDVESGADSTTRFYRTYATWSHDFDPTFSFTIQAGPTWVDSEQDDSSVSSTALVQSFPLQTSGAESFFTDIRTCPTLSDGTPYLSSDCAPLPGAIAPANLPLITGQGTVVPVVVEDSGNSSKLTYFGSLDIAKKWRDFTASAGYRRSNGTTSGTGSSTVNDTVSGSVSWRPDRLWTISLTARWDRQKSATKQLVFVQTLGAPAEPIVGVPVPNAAFSSGLTTVRIDDALNIKTTSVYLRVERRLTRRLATFARAVWTDQTSKRTTINTNSYDDVRVGIGFRYEFDPIEVPYL